MSAASRDPQDDELGLIVELGQVVFKAMAGVRDAEAVPGVALGGATASTTISLPSGEWWKISASRIVGSEEQ